VDACVREDVDSLSRGQDMGHHEREKFSQPSRSQEKSLPKAIDRASSERAKRLDGERGESWIASCTDPSSRGLNYRKPERWP